MTSSGIKPSGLKRRGGRNETINKKEIFNLKVPV
jgi:hypothetical protein